jgi:1,4-alpha-glucan branching enzyme
VVDGHAYPDPASRSQPEGVHGASEVVDPGAYAWTASEWRGRSWEETVLYELHLGTFSETGDFAGAIRHLDHVRELGATAVELMPIAEFPGTRGWGYDGTYLYAPSSRYGRPEDLKRLVEACHERAVAVFLDVVYNHFGPEGNYLSVIAPDFFTERHQTPWGAALDFSGPLSRPVRDFMIHNALYWLEEYGFDGLRLDAVHAIHDAASPTSSASWRRPSAAKSPTGKSILFWKRPQRGSLPDASGRSGRLLYGAMERRSAPMPACLITGEDIGFMRIMRAAPGQPPRPRLGRRLCPYQGEPSPFRSGQTAWRTLGGAAPQLPSSLLQNHDAGRQPAVRNPAVDAAADAALHAGIAIALLSPQIRCCSWARNGERAALPVFAISSVVFADVGARGRRREFAHFPEFRDAPARQNIPDPTLSSTFEESKLDWVEPTQQTHAGWLARYRRLLAIRHA